MGYVYCAAYMENGLTSLTCRSTSITIIILSQFSTRDSTALIRSIARSLLDNKIQMQYALFTANDERGDGQNRIGDCPLTSRKVLC